MTLLQMKDVSMRFGDVQALKKVSLDVSRGDWLATPGTLQSCTDLATKAKLANTTIASSTLVAAGALTVTGVTTPMPEHCLVKGEMNRRTSAVDGKSYAIGFEMRLPTAWNGRYFYQANGGIDGSVVTATGPTSGGAPVSASGDM